MPGDENLPQNAAIKIGRKVYQGNVVEIECDYSRRDCLGETQGLCKQFAKIAKMTYYLCDSKYRERYLGL